MALCPDCRTVIPCHCHLAPPVQIRPGVYEATEPHPARRPNARDAEQATATDRATEK